MHRFYFFLLLLLILCTSVCAQKSQDLRQDEAFFNEQAKNYQKWLDKAGLGQYFRFRELTVEPNDLNLYLEFYTDNLNLMVNQWNTAKESFEEGSALNLEQQLFYKAASLMEVPQQQLTVEIYNDYSMGGVILFGRQIYFAEGKVEVQESDPKSKIDKINLKPLTISGGKAISAADFREQYNKGFVFKCIADFATERFVQDKCDNRNPEVRILEDQELLRFEVLDLCKEVLADENSTICGWLSSLGYNCNWAKRELLTFTIAHENTLEGIRITVELDGKVGSGFYADVQRGGYVSMEVDRDQELENYADELAIEIRKMLEKCQN